MNSTIVERARQVISVEGDDYFDDDTVLYYANQAYKKVVSFLINEEKYGFSGRDSEGRLTRTSSNSSLRALDKLRVVKLVNNNEIDYTDLEDYVKGVLEIPEDLQQFLYLKPTNNKQVFREINFQDLSLLNWGNLRPSQYEGYFYITTLNVESENKEVFLLFVDDETNLEIFYIKKPTEIETQNEVLPDLPERFINCVVYQTAIMMSIQENIEKPSTNLEALLQIYTDELQSNVY